jgi:hypothetical protein
MVIDTTLALKDALTLSKDYTVVINSLWTLYPAALAAVLTALNAKSWKPQPELLAGAFAIFAAANAYTLYTAFETKRAAVKYAGTLVSPQSDLGKLVNAMMPPDSLGMVIFHVVLDLAVITVIFLIARHARRAHAQNSSPILAE